MAGQGIDAGDAVLTFLGDTTQLDLAFDKVEQETQQKLEPTNVVLKEVAGNWQFTGQAATTAGAEAEVAGDEMVDAAERSAKATREARGEAGLLGEAFGVHLPRHVRSFIAELPGVSEALSAAFAATAILFIIQAVVELTNKITEFVSSHFIFTESMKAATAAIILNNVELLKQADAYKQAKDQVENFGKTTEELANDKLTKLNESLDKTKERFREVSDNLYGARNGNLLGFTPEKIAEFENEKNLLAASSKALEEQITAAELAQQKIREDNYVKHQQSVINIHKTATEAIINLQEAQSKAAVSGDQDAQSKIFAIEQASDERRLNAKVSFLQKELALEQQFGGKDNADKVAKIEADIQNVREEYATKYFTLLAKEKEELKKTLDGMAADARATQPQIEIVVPEAVQRILQMRGAAQALGITLRSDLVAALDLATRARKAFTDAGGKDEAALRAFDKDIKDAQKNVDNYGKSLDRLKLKGETTFRGLQQDLKQGVDVTHELGVAGQQAFDQMSKGVESAIASAILGQKNFGKALEEATAQALAQLASQALVKSLFYTAEGFAALAGFAYGPAAQYFEAAGIMAAVGTAAGLAGHALSGGGGGSGSAQTGQTQSSMSNTSNQAGGRAATGGVQQFGDGALVSKPTLAMIGERAGETEAVLPLDHPASLKKIGDAMAAAGAGGGRHMHVHVKGLVSPDHLSKVIGQIDKKVRTGGASLHSSNSFRITRRSA